MKSFSQTVRFSVSPEKVYEALMDEKKHSEFTGSVAKIENKIGGKFNVWDGYATGETIDLDPGKKIAQKWRASNWPEGQYSIVIFDLAKEVEGTRLDFSQRDIPDSDFDEIEKGWEEYYWEALQKYLEK